MKQNDAGFSLIELIIVVLIIGIIATIAIPNLLASRRAANEASAIATLKIMRYAGLTYQNTTGSGYAPPTLDTFFDQGYISRTQFQNGTDYTGTPAYTKSGYAFKWAVNPAQTEMNFSAVPVVNSGQMRTGNRSFIYLHNGDFYYYYTFLFDTASAYPVGEK